MSPAPRAGRAPRRASPASLPRFRPDPRWRLRRWGSEWVLFDGGPRPRDRRVFRINATAASCWETLAGGASPDECVRRLAREFAAPRGIVRRDVRDLIGIWKSGGLGKPAKRRRRVGHPVGEGSPGVPAPPGPPAALWEEVRSGIRVVPHGGGPGVLLRGGRAESWRMAVLAGRLPEDAPLWMRRLWADPVKALAGPPGLRRLISLFDAESAGEHGTQTPETYYRLRAGGWGHFDEAETTLSHLYRGPHAVFGGRNYGEALVAALRRTGAWPRRGAVVEIGPGRGDVHEALRGAAASSRTRTLTALDAAHGMLRDLPKRVRGVIRVAGSAERWPFADRSIALAVSNEVLDDLAVSPVRWRRGRAGSVLARGPGSRAVGRYGLDLTGAPPSVRISTGALRFVEECARCLAPGGAAVATDYGTHWLFPVPVRLRGHTEYSVYFPWLVQAAEAHGLRAEIISLSKLLNADLTVPVLSWGSMVSLRRLGACHGRPIAVRAWTRCDLDRAHPGLAARVKGLRWFPAGEDPEFPWSDFRALVLRRPMPPAVRR